MKLLLISNSTNPGEAYLEHPKKDIENFLTTNKVKKILFVPYAGVSISWERYTKKVAERFNKLGCETIPLHKTENPHQAIQQAECIVVGGGNTWNLLNTLYKNDLLAPVREKVKQNTPYIGWSAGSNLACPSIKTTNDMPIVSPPSFEALNLIPFQINPHFTNFKPAGHGGESRTDRIKEFLILNPEMYVVGLREGTSLLAENGKLSLLGPKTAKIFKKDQNFYEVKPGNDLSFLM